VPPAFAVVGGDDEVEDVDVMRVRRFAWGTGASSPLNLRKCSACARIISRIKGRLSGEWCLNSKVVEYGVIAVIFGVLMISPLSSVLFPYSGRYTAAVGLGLITGGMAGLLYGLVADPYKKHRVPLRETQPSIRRPRGLTIMSVLWIFGGLYNFFVGLSGFVTDLSVFLELQSGYQLGDQGADVWASWAVPTETTLMAIIVVLGVLQFATAYGFWTRKNWSYKWGITIPLLIVAINWFLVALALSAPPSLSIMVNFTIPFLNAVFAVIYILYLRKPYVKDYLCVNVEGH